VEPGEVQGHARPLTVVSPIITLTTDFGLSDPYVASMKGIILSINPDVVIADITHAVEPQQIEQGAFLLAAAWSYFPSGSIHVAVVDPGVGTERRAIALATPAGTFVGPDNGILSAALPDQARRAAGEKPHPVPLPPGTAAHLLTNERFHRIQVSATFHGRDIFAPVAAHLSRGVPLDELGPPVGEIMALPPFRARSQPDGSLLGRVIHIDRFGNLITDVRAEQLPPPLPLVVEIAGRRIRGLSPTYGHGTGLLALIGSSGFLEIALRQGSAALELGAHPGDSLLVRGA